MHNASLKGTNNLMAQTLVSLYAHIIFSTKNRTNLITPEIEPDLFSYIGGILNNNKSKLLTANGTSDHVHLLISLSKNLGLSKLVGDIKRDSSVLIKKQDSQFNSFYCKMATEHFQSDNLKSRLLKITLQNRK
jgi:putative transposase